MQNQTQVATALQVFYNLGSLVSTVSEVVNKVRDNLKSGVKEALDPNTLSQVQPITGIWNPSGTNYCTALGYISINSCLALGLIRPWSRARD